MKKTIIFSHNDLDGFASPFILEKMLKITNPETYPSNKDFDFRHCNTGSYGDIDERIIKFMDNNQFYYYDSVFITDLTPSLEVMTRLVSFCQSKGIYLKLYDHHATSSYMKDLFSEVVYLESEIDGIKTAAASIVYDEYAKNISIEAYKEHASELQYLKELSQIVRSYDTWDWYNDANDKYGTAAEDFNRIFTYIYKNKYRETLDSKTSILFTDEERLILKVLKSEESKYVYKKTLESLVSFRVLNYKDVDYKVGLVIADSHKNAISNVLFEKYPIDIAIILDRDIISLRKNVNVSIDVDLGELSKDLFNGGGHSSAAGGHIVGLNDEIDKALKLKK